MTGRPPLPAPLPAPLPVRVRGGVGGIVAHTDELKALACRTSAIAEHTLGTALTLHGYLGAPALLASSLLDPIGFGRFEFDLLAALDGPRGLSVLGTACGALDGELRAAASSYLAADRLDSDALHGVLDLPSGLVAGAAAIVRTGHVGAFVPALLARDPAVADDVALTAGGLLGTAAVVAPIAALPDGHGVSRPTGIDAGGLAGRPPRDLEDVVGELNRRNHDLRPGEIDVRVLHYADGTRRAIVDITGTRSWGILPTSDVTSLTTNARAIIGRTTAYAQGVLAALQAAGVGPHDDVLLVGHSEGGMVAVGAARTALATGRFAVTHVITAGAPIARTVGALPSRVQVLALEGEHDVIPHLDGAANPDRPNVTTVSSDHGDGTIRGDHGLPRTYLPVARDAEASGNRSIRAFLASARGYFTATSVTTHTYQIQRRY